MTYAADHAMALEMIRESGSAVTFQTGTPGTHDPETDLHTSPTTATVTGYAIKVRPDRGDEDVYRAAGLSVDRVVTLLFGPSTFGSVPEIGARVTWGSDALTVRTRSTVAPDGTAILARLGCVK